MDSSLEKPRSLSILLTTLWPGLPYLGLGVWLAWQLLILSGGSWISDEPNSYFIGLISLILCCSTALVLFIAPFFGTFVQKILESKPYMLSLGSLGALGALFLILGGPHYLGTAWIAHLGLVLCGISSAFMALKCGQMYGALSPPKILIFALLSELLAVSIFFFVLGSSFYFLIPGGPPLVSSIALLCLPLVAVWILVMRTRTPQPEPSSQEPSRAGIREDNNVRNGEGAARGSNGATTRGSNGGTTRGSNGATTRGSNGGTTRGTSEGTTSLREIPAVFWKLTVAVFVFSLAATSTRSLYIIPQLPSAAQMDADVVAFLLVLFSVGILLLAIRFLRNINYNRIYLIAAMLIAAALVITALLPFQSSLLSSITGFAVSVLDFTIWCLLALFVSIKRFSSIVAFGFGRGVAFLGAGIGWALGLFAIPSWQDTPFELGFNIFLALLVIFAAIFLFTEKDYDSMVSTASENELNLQEYASIVTSESNKKSNQERPWMAACIRVGASVQLTEREQQVLEQISLGRSQKFIAKKMTISHNTVRTHTGNLYAKLNIHSREELVSLIEVEFDKYPR